MPFAELIPSVKGDDIGTGCRVSIGKRGGLRLSLAASVLKALGDPNEASRFKIFLDRDPAMPRLRIKAAKDGQWKIKSNSLSTVWHYMIVGQQVGIPSTPMSSTMVQWESIDEKNVVGIDIDLPPQFSARSTVQPVGRPSTSTGPRPSAVTVAGRAR